MTSKQINQTDSISYQPTLPLDLTFLRDDILADPLVSLIKEFVEEHLNWKNYPSLAHWPEKTYPRQMMLETIILAYSEYGYASLRDIEHFCKFDLRARFLLNQACPSHNTVGKYINQCIAPCHEDLFHELNEFIEKKDKGLDTEVLYLDGTKIEANANKYTFVWIKATKKYRKKALVQENQVTRKLNKLFEEMGLDVRLTILNDSTPEELLKKSVRLDQIKKDLNIPFVHGKGQRKSQFQRLYEEYDGLIQRLMKYARQIEIAGDRNSYSKTDHDATMMHMKYDYYCNTNVFKAGYNVQVGVSSGYARVILVSSNCSDTTDFIPTVEKYHKMYGSYPKAVPSDAGYGSFENFKYCKEHGIELMMKYNTQSKESHITKKDRFKSYAFDKAPDGSPICPAGHVMEACGQRTDYRGRYPKTTTWYSCQHCAECPLKSQCTKSKAGRKVQLCHELEDYKAEVRENMSTERGHQLMVSRSIQAEGTFGTIKENQSYDRFRRRGKNRVELELSLVFMGHNFRKLVARQEMTEKELAAYGKERLN